MATVNNQGVGPWHVVEPDPYLINDVFRQIEEQINRLRGLGVPISIVVHTHQTTAQGGKLDHGAALTGLADNDHPQYLLASAVLTDQAVEQATSVDRISDQLMVDATLTLTEQADGSGDAVQVKLADTAVTPGTCGDATNVSQITVDQQGRLTNASNVAIVVTATEANDVASVEGSETDSRITDQVMVGEDLALTEPGEMPGDSIHLDVATVQTLDDGQGGAAQGFETVVDGLADFGVAIDSTGRPHLQGQNRFRYLNSMAIAARTTAQTISNATFTVVAFNATDILDTDGLHDPASNNSRLVAAITGKYFIFAFVGFTTNATGIRSFTIEKNSAGVETIANAVIQQTFNAVNGGQSGTSLAAFISLAAGEYVEVFCYQDSTGNLDMNGATITNAFGMVYVGE